MKTIISTVSKMAFDLICKGLVISRTSLEQNMDLTREHYRAILLRFQSRPPMPRKTAANIRR